MTWERTPIHRLCVFCGASQGRRSEYRDAAVAMGEMIAARGFELVYGGGNIGLMGVISNACLEAGGQVIGVIPESLMGREFAGELIEHPGITRLEVVDSMHTRKARMAELADGFIALPGGFGTFEELFEILTWAQLGFHHKPVGLLDVAGYFEPLRALCDQAVAEGFLRPENRAQLLAHTDPSALLEDMVEYQSPAFKAWVNSAEQL
ncbi:MAG: hypothetical protein RL661_337 [Pseudomonadota bacterium]